jgi:hypothetical protein
VEVERWRKRIEPNIISGTKPWLQFYDQGVPQGEIGELIMQGPQVMRAWWRMPTETAHKANS